MARFAQIICAMTLIVFAVTSPVRADPINILSGSVVIQTPGGDFGSADLLGTRGFSLTARAGLPTGVGLFEQCSVPECQPATRVNFNLDLSGASGFLGGVMTIEGDRYDVSDDVNARADVFLHFDGSFIAPAMGPDRTTVTAPFSLTGRAFALTPFGSFAHDEQLFGRGVGIVTLVPFNPQAGFDPSWTVEKVRFDFAQPTPEPSTLLLIGTCVAAPVIRRMQRSRASR
jgi:PEP-CTERM motif